MEMVADCYMDDYNIIIDDEVKEEVGLLKRDEITGRATRVNILSMRNPDKIEFEEYFNPEGYC